MKHAPGTRTIQEELDRVFGDGASRVPATPLGQVPIEFPSDRSALIERACEADEGCITAISPELLRILSEQPARQPDGTPTFPRRAD